MANDCFSAFYLFQLIRTSRELISLTFSVSNQTDKYVYRRHQLKCYLECMMIDILVDIEEMEDVQCVRVIDLSEHPGIRGKAGKQMGAMDNGVQMDDTHVSVGIVATSVLGFNNP